MQRQGHLEWQLRGRCMETCGLCCFCCGQAQYLVTLDLFRVVFVLAGALVGAAARSLGIAAPWQVHGNLWTVLLLLWQAQCLVTLDLFRVVFVLAGALVGAAARSLGIAAPWQVHGNRTVLLLLWQAQYLVTLDLFRVVFVLAGALVGAAARSLGIAAPWQVHGNRTVLLLLWQAQYLVTLDLFRVVFCPSRGALYLLSQSFEYGRPRKFALADRAFALEARGPGLDSRAVECCVVLLVVQSRSVWCCVVWNSIV